MLLNDYAAWVRGEVFGPTEHPWHPAEMIEGWSRRWMEIHGQLADGGHVFEATAIVFARLEFLGALFMGATGNTDFEEVLRFSAAFLEPLNNAYSNLNELPGFPASKGSLLFTMLRNKPLHGYTPAGVFEEASKEVAIWKLAAGPGKNLTFSDGVVSVFPAVMVRELELAMAKYAEYLRSDLNKVEGRSPTVRFGRGFWARFCPVNYTKAQWMILGENGFGVPR